MFYKLIKMYFKFIIFIIFVFNFTVSSSFHALPKGTFPSEYLSGLDSFLFGSNTPSAYIGQVNHVNGISGMKFLLLMCYNTYCRLYVETLKELHPLGFSYYISLTLICLCTTIIMQLRLS